MQRREAVRLAVQHVELVRELVDHDVDAVGIFGLRDVGPRQDDRALQPRLAGVGLVALMHDTGFVDVLMTRHEFRGIDDDLAPAAIVLEPEIQDQRAGLDGDMQAHRLR